MGKDGAVSAGAVEEPAFLGDQEVVNAGKPVVDLFEPIAQVADEGFFIGERDCPGGTHPGAGANRFWRRYHPPVGRGIGASQNQSEKKTKSKAVTS